MFSLQPSNPVFFRSALVGSAREQGRHLFVLSFLLAVLPALAQPAPQRIAFTLKNNLGYHRMFRAEGPGVAYGFTMNKNERTEKSWPIGTKLYYSNDGETTLGTELLTVGEHLAGRVVPVYQSLSEQKGSPLPEVRIRLRNNSSCAAECPPQPAGHCPRLRLQLESHLQSGDKKTHGALNQGSSQR